MPRGSQIYCVRIHLLAIPLRRTFEHATQSRDTSDPVVVEVELADGTVGYGETLARPYVTGETPEGVLETIRTVMPEYLVQLRPSSFPEALEGIDPLPSVTDAGVPITAARAAVELALLDAYSRHFQRPISEAAGWLDVPGLGPPGSLRTVRYSGVLSGRDVGRLARRVRMMRWYGLRDLKLKVGYDNDLTRVETVVRTLGRSLGHSTTLRLDANGAWTFEQAARQLGAMSSHLIACVEQPLARSDDERLAELKRSVGIDIMPDESLVTLDDAQRLVELGGIDRLNIRISKNGGLLPALRLAHFARRHELGCQLGCMVGETSILSAAGRRFLENVAGVCFAEGSYGRFLLTGDVVRRPVQFGCGGKPVALAGFGWGIDVQSDRLRQYALAAPTEVRL